MTKCNFRQNAIYQGRHSRKTIMPQLYQQGNSGKRGIFNDSRTIVESLEVKSQY